MTPDRQRVVNTTGSHGFPYLSGSRGSVAYVKPTVSPMLSEVQLNVRQLDLDQLDSRQYCGPTVEDDGMQSSRWQGPPGPSTGFSAVHRCLHTWLGLLSPSLHRGCTVV
ncbi:hypothetical protein E2C01_101784 [Portunus trituberculatus]|uniref:Uncharacterized protein n=1 Tax=Portunus trituberculatus TaxID=210409 RepID=A0A5B7KGX0_PORTR|nr:hypothetical protein [Portunus trituberculatus]